MPPVERQVRSASMGISPYLRQLRAAVGHEFLLVPSVAVLAWDDDGRLLLVREAQTGLWQTIGGAVEPDESPYQAAVREAAEEAGVSVRIERLRDVAGGPQFRLRYPNGDLVGYVPTIFDARVIDGQPRPDGEETIEVAWFSAHQLGTAALTEFTRALFGAVGIMVGAEQAGPGR
jgi:8-oxo-dGTP pyrophosphatase MutT (NUDIX family)